MSADETSPLLPTTDQPPTEATQPQDDTMSTLLWKTGAVFGATAVGLGAFGAHGLKKHISEPHKLANWGTAAQYQVSRAAPVPFLITTLNLLANPAHSSSTRSLCLWRATILSPAASLLRV